MPPHGACVICYGTILQTWRAYGAQLLPRSTTKHKIPTFVFALGILTMVPQPNELSATRRFNWHLHPLFYQRVGALFLIAPQMKRVGENDISEHMMRTVVRDVDGRIKLKVTRHVTGKPNRR